MRILKKIASVLLVLVFIALFLAPVGMIWKISEAEQQQYLPAADEVLEDLAYGEIRQVIRTDIPETVTVSGSVVSTATKFIELDGYWDPFLLRMTVESGQTIRDGDIIGYYNGEPVLSDKTGIVKSVNIGTDSYIWLQSLDSLALRIEVNKDAVLAALQQEDITLTDADGATYRVLEIAPAMTEAGNAVVLLSCEGKKLVYGQQHPELTLQTGRIFQQALVVEKSCVYTPTGSDKKYVREVDDSGKFLREVEVTVGYSSEEYICISGIGEGAFCDSGYKAVVESRGNP